VSRGPEADGGQARKVGGAPPGGHRATYRGVRWRRDAAGTMAWFNDGIKRWVRWYPGADAPPLPPRWEAETAPPLPPRLNRPAWRSPYRLVPVALVIVVIVLGVYQATKTTSDPIAAETRTAEALVGKCLAQDGISGGHPKYLSRPVPCALPTADVKVESIRSGVPGRPTCPAGTTPVQLPALGVRYPHVECVLPVRPRG
jgi:hypothetical protein